LKDTSMRDAETTSNGEVTRAAGDSSEQMVLFPVRRVRESQTRIEVIARPIPVVDEVITFLRRADVLIARTDVQNEVVRRAPVVLRVEILLIEPVRQRGRPECLGERSHAAGPKRGDRRGIGDSAAAGVEAPEAAVEAFGVVAQVGAADVGPEL